MSPGLEPPVGARAEPGPEQVSAVGLERGLATCSAFRNRVLDNDRRTGFRSGHVPLADGQEEDLRITREPGSRSIYEF